MPRLDPRIKQAIKQALQGHLYAPVNRRAAETLRSIIVSNTTAARYTHESFNYKGQYYSFERARLRFNNQRLVPELHLSMDEYLAEKQHLEYTEVPYVVGFFNKMLNASNSVEDYKLILPDYMHAAIDNDMTVQLNSVVLAYPRELTDEQIAKFQLDHHDLLMKLKTRKVLDLITV